MKNQYSARKVSKRVQHQAICLKNPAKQAKIHVWNYQSSVYQLIIITSKKWG